MWAMGMVEGGPGGETEGGGVSEEGGQQVVAATGELRGQQLLDGLGLPPGHSNNPWPLFVRARVCQDGWWWGHLGNWGL